MSLTDWFFWAAYVALLGALAVAAGRWYVQLGRALGALGMLLLSASSYYDYSKPVPYRAAWVMICILFALVDMALFTRHWLHHKEGKHAVQGQHEGQVHGGAPEEAGG